MKKSTFQLTVSTSKGSRSEGVWVVVWGWVELCSEVRMEDDCWELEERGERGVSGVMSP